MLLTKREAELNEKQQRRFWEIVLSDVPQQASALIKDRIAAGYNAEGFWRTYPFPEGIAALLTLKYVRVKSMADRVPAERLLVDDVFLDNVVDLMNYARLLAGVVLFLREEGVG